MPVKHTHAKSIAMDDARAKANVFLLLAFALNSLVTIAYSQPLDGTSLLFESIGLTVPMALPAWLGHVSMRRVAPAHGFTLAIAVLAALGKRGNLAVGSACVLVDG